MDNSFLQIVYSPFNKRNDFIIMHYNSQANLCLTNFRQAHLETALDLYITIVWSLRWHFTQLVSTRFLGVLYAEYSGKSQIISCHFRDCTDRWERMSQVLRLLSVATQRLCRAEVVRFSAFKRLCSTSKYRSSATTVSKVDVDVKLKMSSICY